MDASDPIDVVRSARRDLERLFAAAVRAVDPTRLVEACVHREGDWVSVCVPGGEVVRWRGVPIVVGAGKAAARMAAGCETVFGPDAPRGLVIVADGCGVRLGSIELAEASHPLPDRRALQASERLCRCVREARRPLLCLIGGGASSLLVRPRPPVMLADKQTTVGLLLASGASIDEVNAVRKHLSMVKGGGLLRFGPWRPMVGLLLSDVVGDDPSVIGSGPTAADASTFGDAWAVIRRLGLESSLPDSVRDLLLRGRRAGAPETVKPGERELDGVSNILIGSNRTALEGAADAARQLGFRVVVRSEPIVGDTTAAARSWAAAVVACVGSLAPAPVCVVAGGETTVTVRGGGHGGRNQEFALAAASSLAGTGIQALSAGTDGVDGPTDAAGAFVDGTTLDRARRAGLDAERALRENDSHSFFNALGDLFRTGPTGTNVMDVKIAVGRASRHAGTVLQD